MATVNSVVIVGNLTRDPELRTIPSGTSVCEIGVAVNEREKVGESWEDRANFFDVTVWGKQGEAVANHLSKGSQVAVQGRLRYESWEDKDGGGKRSKIKVVAQSVQFLGSKNDSSGASAPAASDDDLPF